MKDFKLIENTNNLEISNFDLDFTDNLSEYVAQKLRIKLSIFKDEWYLDNTIGIDYFGQILIKNPNINLIEDVYKAKIASVESVDEILEFALLFDNTTRTLNVEFTVKLINGEEVSLNV